MENITKYDVSFVHPIAGKLAEKGSISESRALSGVRAFLELSVRSNDVDVRKAARKKLGSVLRETGLLTSGVGVREFRIETDSETRFRIIVFPFRSPGGNHSLTLRPEFATSKARLEEGLAAVEARASKTA